MKSEREMSLRCSYRIGRHGSQVILVVTSKELQVTRQSCRLNM